MGTSYSQAFIRSHRQPGYSEGYRVGVYGYVVARVRSPRQVSRRHLSYIRRCQRRRRPSGTQYCLLLLAIVLARVPRDVTNRHRTSLSNRLHTAVECTYSTCHRPRTCQRFSFGGPRSQFTDHTHVCLILNRWSWVM